MAYNGIEIELRVELKPEEWKDIRNNIRKMAKLDKRTAQIDRYITPKHRNFLKSGSVFEWLSVRERGDKAILNYKHFYPEKAKVKKYCKEYEVEVSNASKLNKILDAMNFIELIKVKKERETYLLKNGFEVAFDNVDGLGSFIEIEVVRDFGGIGKARSELDNFARSIGIDPSRRLNIGYPHMFLSRMGLTE